MNNEPVLDLNDPFHIANFCRFTEYVKNSGLLQYTKGYKFTFDGLTITIEQAEVKDD